MLGKTYAHHKNLIVGHVRTSKTQAMRGCVYSMQKVTYLQGTAVTLLSLLQKAIPTNRSGQDCHVVRLVEKALRIAGSQELIVVPITAAAEVLRNVVAKRILWSHGVRTLHQNLCTHHSYTKLFSFHDVIFIYSPLCISFGFSHDIFYMIISFNLIRCTYLKDK